MYPLKNAIFQTSVITVISFLSACSTYCSHWQEYFYQKSCQGMLDVPVLDLKEIMSNFKKQLNTELKLFNRMHLRKI